MKAAKIAALVFAVAAVAVAGERVLLWPEGKMPDAQPQQIAAMLYEQQTPGFNPDEHRAPYIEWLAPPTKPNGTCMVCQPKLGRTNGMMRSHSLKAKKGTRQ